MANDSQNLQAQSQAAFLLKSGLRIPLVRSLTGMSWRSLRDLWEVWHGSDIHPPGRMPSNAFAYIKAGQSQVALATLVTVYLSLEKEHQTPTDAFVAAWASTRLFQGQETQLDINAAWYAVRDTKAGLMSFCKCKDCKAGYFFDAKETRKKTKCVFCGSLENSLAGATQCN